MFTVLKDVSFSLNHTTETRLFSNAYLKGGKLLLNSWCPFKKIIQYKETLFPNFKIDNGKTKPSRKMEANNRKSLNDFWLE